MCVYSTL